MRVLFALMTIVPASLLVMLYTAPLFKDIMISVVETWGVAAGLGGFALLIANMMPLIVPVMCFAAIIAGLIGLTRSKGGV